MAIMEQELASGKRHTLNLSLIMVDLDFFKQINDTYGHGIGDAVLTTIGKLLIEVKRTSDIVARWGGEEFMITCPQTDLDGAAKLAKKIQSRLAEQESPQGIKLTASFGVAQCQLQENLDQFVDKVDLALYRSKKNGRNQIHRAEYDT